MGRTIQIEVPGECKMDDTGDCFIVDCPLYNDSFADGCVVGDAKEVKAFTIEEFKNYLKEQNSYGDIFYNLTVENVKEANSEGE